MKKVIGYFTFVLFLTACVGEDFIDDKLAMKERLSIVAANSGNADTVNVGDTIFYAANFFDINGNEQAQQVDWSSSKIEFASIDANGMAVGRKAGATNISAFAKDLTDERLLVVRQLQRIEISSTSTALLVGDSLTLSAKYFDKNGNPASAVFNWTSSNSSIAEVNSNGRLLAVGSGQAEIVASFNNIQSEVFRINVVSDTNAVASVEISASVTNIEVGGSLQFDAIVKNSNGTPISGNSVSWQSSDVSVLSVNSTGLAAANEVGSSVVTASVNQVQSNEISVLVNQAMTTSRMGTFQGRNNYRVSGTVVLSAQNNTQLQLDFSNFSSQNGPGLYVYLSNSLNGGIELEALNQRSGSFSILLPANITIDDYDFVLIWCKPFGVPFGSAQLN